MLSILHNFSWKSIDFSKKQNPCDYLDLTLPLGYYYYSFSYFEIVILVDLF